MYLFIELGHPDLDSHFCITLQQAGVLLNSEAHLCNKITV